MRWVPLALLCLAFAAVEVLVGGTRLLFSLPSYGLLAALGLVACLGPRQTQRPVDAACLLVTGILAGFIGLRAWLSPVEYLARTDLCLLFGALLVYLLTTLVLTRTRERLGFVAALLGFAVAQTALGAWQHLRGERVTLFGVLEPEDYGLRASGFFICPNHLAGFLEVTFLFGLGVACWSRRAAWVRVLAAFGAVASLFGLALTASRSGYVSAALGLLVFGGLSLAVLRRAGARRGWAAALMGLVLAGILAGGFAFVLGHQRALQLRAEKLIPQDDPRLVLWNAAWKQAQVRPLTGTGSGTYQYYARRYRPALLQVDPGHAHNEYLELLAEYGALGLLAGLAFLGVHAWRALRGLRDGLREFVHGSLPQDDRLALTLAALASVAACATHALFDFNLHVPANALLIAFAFGLLASAGNARGEPAPADERATRFARFALPATALWISVVALPTLPAEFQAERARTALRFEHYAEAISNAQSGLNFDPKNPCLWLFLGQAHASLAETNPNPAAARESWQAAARAFERGVPLYPHEQWLLIGLGEALDGLHRFDEADPVFRRAADWNPTSAVVHYHRATHLRLAGRNAEAEAEFRKSLDCFYNPAAARGMELLAHSRQQAKE